MTSQFSRTAIFVSLALAIGLVVGVIFGARYYFYNVARGPVGVTDLPSPDAGSEQCDAVLADLPDKFMGDPRSEIVEPVPVGVAAWSTYSDQTTTLRCGVELPYQYNKYSETEEIDGAQWLQIIDPTKGSTLQTWYTTDRFPVVAVTTFKDEKPKGIKKALENLEQKDLEPNPAPLTNLQPAEKPRAARQACDPLFAELPETLATDYQRIETAEDDIAIWAKPGHEQIALRCGVAPPPGYGPGEQIEQVSDIPWFNDTTLGQGTTAGTWYALGRTTDIAAYIPTELADSVLVQLGDVIAQETPEDPKSNGN